MSKHSKFKQQLYRVERVKMSTSERFNCKECGIILPKRAKESDLKHHIRIAYVKRREHYGISNEEWAEYKKIACCGFYNKDEER